MQMNVIHDRTSIGSILIVNQPNAVPVLSNVTLFKALQRLPIGPKKLTVMGLHPPHAGSLAGTIIWNAKF
jgi:hypothetical protein